MMIKNRQPEAMLLPMTMTAIAIALTVNYTPAIAADYFDPGLLSLNGNQIAAADLSDFGVAGQVPPGTYTVELFVNQIDMGQQTVTFSSDGKGKVQPELTPDFLSEIGVNTPVLPSFLHLPVQSR